MLGISGGWDGGLNQLTYVGISELEVLVTS